MILMLSVPFRMLLMVVLLPRLPLLAPSRLLLACSCLILLPNLPLLASSVLPSLPRLFPLDIS